MLHEALVQYLQDIETSVHSIKGAYVERYEEEILGVDRVNLRIRMRFSNGYLLELNEAVIVEEGCIQHLGYRYHLQDGQTDLVFRYDNTPHFSQLESFPHHKHLSDGVVASQQPLVPQVIEEAKSCALEEQGEGVDVRDG